VTAGLVDGQPHGEGGDVVAQPLGAVVERGGRVIPDDRRLALHHDEPLLPQLVIPRQHVDPVRVPPRKSVFTMSPAVMSARSPGILIATSAALMNSVSLA
jgi:hypothetical protein